MWISAASATATAGPPASSTTTPTRTGKPPFAAGVTPIDRLLLYVTGGVTFTELKYHWDINVVGPPPVDASISTTGWTAGGGAEVALTNVMTARVEYRYSDFGTTRFDWPGVGGSYEQKPRFQSVRGGISFKF